MPRRWKFSYRDLSQADKATLETFEKTVAYGGDSFTWLNPTDNLTYTVRFSNLIQFRIEPENPMTWQADIELAEAYPGSGV